jgi:hypothetical protein
MSLAPASHQLHAGGIGVTSKIDARMLQTVSAKDIHHQSAYRYMTETRASDTTSIKRVARCDFRKRVGISRFWLNLREQCR